MFSYVHLQRRGVSLHPQLLLPSRKIPNGPRGKAEHQQSQASVCGSVNRAERGALALLPDTGPSGHGNQLPVWVPVHLTAYLCTMPSMSCLSVLATISQTPRAPPATAATARQYRSHFLLPRNKNFYHDVKAQPFISWNSIGGNHHLEQRSCFHMLPSRTHGQPQIAQCGPISCFSCINGRRD